MKKKCLAPVLAVLIILLITTFSLSCSTQSTPSSGLQEITDEQVAPDSGQSDTEEPEPDYSEETQAEEPTEAIVHVTRTGECYHEAGCRYLSKSDSPISLEEAQAAGYRPCSVCNPPQ